MAPPWKCDLRGDKTIWEMQSGAFLGPAPEWNTMFRTYYNTSYQGLGVSQACGALWQKIFWKISAPAGRPAGDGAPELENQKNTTKLVILDVSTPPSPVVCHISTNPVSWERKMIKTIDPPKHFECSDRWSQYLGSNASNRFFPTFSSNKAAPSEIFAPSETVFDFWSQNARKYVCDSKKWF